MQVTRDNHFVSQSHLRRWAEDGYRIWCYRILVPHENVPEWELRSVQGVAYQRDLYTSLERGQDIDEFERWLEAEFETPAQNAIERAVHGDVLSPSDWERLVRYMVAQDLRTPQNYIDFILRCNDQLPEILRWSCDQAVRHLEEAKRTSRKPQTEPATGKQPFEDVLNIKIDPHARPETKQGEIRVEVVAGRRLWLEIQRHLNKTAQVFVSHSWSIAEVANGTEWFTSDHPVARVNYYGEGNYDIKGGWGKKGGNLLMPLSPKHLLFTEIGEDLPKRFRLSDRQTSEIQRFIAERGHRMIFAHKRMPEVKRLRPRHVNLQMYREEQEAWRNWHSNQSQAERDLEEGK